ncbi:MAG: sialate O-acetylesterase [Nitrospiraceae bacterium]
MLAKDYHIPVTSFWPSPKADYHLNKHNVSNIHRPAGMQARELARYLISFLIGAFFAFLFLDGYHRFREWQVQNTRPSPQAEIPPTRTEVSLATVKTSGVMVALAFGQSNSANGGETPKLAGQRVFNFYKGKLYRAQDPLLGADGTGGSIWTRLGDHLIERKLHENVVFVTIGVDGSEIARWRPSGDLHANLLGTIRELQRNGLSPTHLLWHQGESDAGLRTSKAAYKQMFLEMASSIKQEGVTAPIYVSIATRCKKQRPESIIQEAQAELVDIPKGIYPGPNTDTLGLGYRYDGCHFSDEGLEQAALLWLEALYPAPSGSKHS